MLISLNIDKLEAVLTDLIELSNVVEKTVHDELVKIFNFVDPSKLIKRKPTTT